MVLGGLIDVSPDLGNDGRAECDVGNKMPVPIRNNVSAPSGSSGEGESHMMSTWSQSAPCSMVRAQSWPSWAKSADRIDGAMIALGAIV